MKTAIIILNYNDYNNTSSYVNNIKHYSIIDNIIVVDNNSNDGKNNELKKLESNKIDVVFADKNGGYAYGNNIGLKHLEEKYGKEYFEYVIISNPDVSVTEEAIKKCISKLEENNNIAIAAPRMYFTYGPARRSAWKERKFLVDVANSTRLTELILYPIFKSGEYTNNDFSNNILEVDSIAGSFFVARFSYFKEIGFFDENTFLFFEEDIICKKLREKGYKIVSLNDCNFIHYDSVTIGKIMNMFKKQDILFESRKYYNKKYNNISKFDLLLLESLKILRKFELLFEVPLRKLLKK